MAVAPVSHYSGRRTVFRALRCVALLNRLAYQFACLGRCEVEKLIGAVLLRLPNLNRVLIDHLGHYAQPGGAAVQASSMFLDELPEATPVFPIRFARVVLAKDRCEVTEERGSPPNVTGVIPSFGHVAWFSQKLAS
jgi:hypothetical protein